MIWILIAVILFFLLVALGCVKRSSILSRREELEDLEKCKYMGVNMRVRCTGYKTENDRHFTVGRVYDVIYGELQSDDGVIYKNMVDGEDPAKWLLSGYYDFEVICEEKIIIITDGVKTVAKKYVDGKETCASSAVCFPEDEFDFNVGARIAFDRLMEGDKKSTLNCKFVVISTDIKCFTVGKIYSVVNGYFILNEKFEYDRRFPLDKPIYTFEELEHYLSMNGLFGGDTKILQIKEDL